MILAAQAIEHEADQGAAHAEVWHAERLPGHGIVVLADAILESVGQLLLAPLPLYHAGRPGRSRCLHPTLNRFLRTQKSPAD
jgi:hypothetical protein